MDVIAEPEKKKPRKSKIDFDISKCWFCLSSPSVEKHLIIAVGDFTYLALAKGKTAVFIKTYFNCKSYFFL